MDKRQRSATIILGLSATLMVLCFFLPRGGFGFHQPPGPAFVWSGPTGELIAELLQLALGGGALALLFVQVPRKTRALALLGGGLLMSLTWFFARLGTGWHGVLGSDGVVDAGFWFLAAQLLIIVTLCAALTSDAEGDAPSPRLALGAIAGGAVLTLSALPLTTLGLITPGRIQAIFHSIMDTHSPPPLLNNIVEASALTAPFEALSASSSVLGALFVAGLASLAPILGVSALASSGAAIVGRRRVLSGAMTAYLLFAWVLALSFFSFALGDLPLPITHGLVGVIPLLSVGGLLAVGLIDLERAVAEDPVFASRLPGLTRLRPLLDAFGGATRSAAPTQGATRSAATRTPDPDAPAPPAATDPDAPATSARNTPVLGTPNAPTIESRPPDMDDDDASSSADAGAATIPEGSGLRFHLPGAEADDDLEDDGAATEAMAAYVPPTSDEGQRAAVEAHWNEANAALYAERYEEAIAAYLKVITLDRAHMGACRAVADLYYGLNQLDLAERYYRQLLEISPDDDYALQALEQIEHYRASS